MRLLWGVISLLVVLAAVGVIARKQLETVRVGTPTEGAVSGVGTPSEQSQALQRKVQDDMNKLMQRAPSRGEPTP